MSGKEFMKWQNVNCKRGIWLTDSGTVNSCIFNYNNQLQSKCATNQCTYSVHSTLTVTDVLICCVELLFYKSKSSTGSRKSSASKFSNKSRSYVDSSDAFSLLSRWVCSFV